MRIPAITLGKHLSLALPLALVTFGAGCSGGGGSGSANTIETALQDLDLDPEGLTTVLDFRTPTGLASASTLHFEADGGQSAVAVVVDGDVVTVTWDARVTPNHSVRAVGLPGVPSTYRPVTTSDSSSPSFAVTDASQNAGVGNDTITVAFSGVHVVEQTVEDPASWSLSIDRTPIDLSGSVLTFDAGTQEVLVALGPQAQLHAEFRLAAPGVTTVADVAGSAFVDAVASGDATPPGLVSADQNLGADEYGRVIDFTFDEPMSSVFSTQLSHFSVPLPDVATEVSQPSPEVLRVTFNNPIVPGVDEVELVGLVDVHGNVFATTMQAISQPSPVANAYVGNIQGVTVANAFNDYIVLTTTQAFDPASASDPASWTLTVAGNPVTMADQELEYDFLAKTLTVLLAFDMQNGDTFTMLGNSVLEVDGQTFSAGQFNVIDGEQVPPSVLSVTQNRNVDLRGRTVDVLVSEHIGQASAEDPASWSSSGAQNLVSATRLPSLDKVRLVFDSAVIPGTHTLSASGLADLAGNSMAAPQVGLAVGTTDATPPAPVSMTARAIEGANNDTLAVLIDDVMIEGEIEDAAAWTVSSPPGTPVPTAGATVDYNPSTRIATLTFANGFNYTRGDEVTVSFSGARDLGGNAIVATSLQAAVDAETNLPRVSAVYRESSVADQLVVRFSEPCGDLTTLWDPLLEPAGARYVLHYGVGSTSLATSAVALDDGLGVRVSFGLVIQPGDTLDVIGVRDLAGNPAFPALGLATVAEDTTEPSLAAGLSVFATVSGESNDEIAVRFDRPMSPWGLESPLAYTIGGFSAVSLTGAQIRFDGIDTVTISLASGTGQNLQTGQGYDLSIDEVWSAQGAPRTSPDTEIGILASGDATAPTVALGNVRLDPGDASSVLIEFSEAVDLAAAETPANYDYDGGNLATSAVRVGPRVVRASFAVAPQVGQTVELSTTDLAGNASGSITRAVGAADLSAPLVTGVAGTIAPGFGGDRVTIVFDEPVSLASAQSPLSYTVHNGASTVSLAGAVFSYASATSTVTIRLAGGNDLDATLPLSVTVSGVSDHAGNTMPAPVQVGGPIGGDATAPSMTSGFVNWNADANGTVVDVLFSEDVDASFVTTAANWGAGPTSVSSVTMPERNHARLTLAAQLGASDVLSLSGLPDLAGNASGAIQLDPIE